MKDVKQYLEKMYKEHSLAEHLCEVDSANPPNLVAFEHIFRSDHFSSEILRRGFPIQTSVERDFVNDEATFLINKIKEHSKHVKLEGDLLECIKHEAVSLFQTMDVATIVLPRELRGNVPQWNITLEPLSNGDLQNFLWLGVPKPVRVVFAPQETGFNDVLILGGKCHSLIYAERNKSRLEINHEIRENEIFLNLSAWYRFENFYSECSVIISRNKN